MSFLFLTADIIGTPTGGGAVTAHESLALQELAVQTGQACEVWGREQLTWPASAPDPWMWDQKAMNQAAMAGVLTSGYQQPHKGSPKLVHCYAGTLTETIGHFKQQGSKVSYTAAAHDIQVSKREHERLGLPFNYPHLTDPAQWNRYVGGYRLADLVICPSQHSKRCMESYGCKNVVVIPHGCELPETVAPLPKMFTVGAMGAIGGPDKGLIYLLQAWKQLNYPDAELLLAGGHSNTAWIHHLIQLYGGGRIRLLGWLDNVADFYNSISLLVQPSASEGFGLEVLEAMSYARPVVCSDGAGAADLVSHDVGAVVPACDARWLADRIDLARKAWYLGPMGEVARNRAAEYTWPKIRERYKAAWRGLLA